jgi:hypothetical protein
MGLREAKATVVGVSSPTGNYPETGFAEMTMEATFEKTSLPPSGLLAPE